MGQIHDNEENEPTSDFANKNVNLNTKILRYLIDEHTDHEEKTGSLFQILKLEEAEKMFQRSTEKNTPTISVGMCFETFQTTLEPFVSSLDFNLIISFGEYPEMLDQLEKGILDLIITPKKGTSLSIEHEPFSSEKIILVGGKEVDVTEFKKYLK